MRYLSILVFLALISTNLSADSSIEKNKDRINQIDKQVRDNTTKINNNKNKISTAKKTETEVKQEISNLNSLINKLQNEYNVIEKEYINLLKAIGKNEKEINNNIKKIRESTQKINDGKTDYANKIRMWNKVSNAEVFKNKTNSTDNYKKQIDLIKVLDQEENIIKEIEEFKIKVEVAKRKEEQIKDKNEKEAKKVEKKKKELEVKRNELRTAKASKDKAVKELQSIQTKLSNENKNIEKRNAQLIAEKKKLEAQINAIITTARKKQQDKTKNDEGKAVVIPKGTGQFMMPINGNIVVAYGQEKSKGLTSKGIEIRGSLNQAVKASDSGVILYSGSLKGLGAVIMIDHGEFITVYGNLASVKVANGAKVNKGQVIGTLGRDSITKEPNLYFEVRKGVNYVNPANYL